MNKYNVTVWFKDKSFAVMAKNERDAKKKVYKKLANKKAISLVDKKHIDLY